MGDMFKEKKPFMLSTKFQLTEEFFKHFGHFIDNDFKVYVQHLLEHTLGRVVAFPKVTVHRINLVHPFHHIGQNWMEQRKQKRIIFEKLVELKPALKFLKPDRLVNDKVWRQWKRDLRVCSGTYNIVHLSSSWQSTGHTIPVLCQMLDK